MTDDRQRITALARQTHQLAVERNMPTRQAAAQVLVATNDVALLKAMAAEFLVDLIARSQNRQPATVTPLVQRVTAPARSDSRIPRKGSKARATWENETLAGRAWAAAEAESCSEANARLVESIDRAMEAYAARLKVQWTDELLDSTFRNSVGVLVAWGEATVDEHQDRLDQLFKAAGDRLKDAAVHQAAIAELEASKATTLRQMLNLAVP